MELSQSQSNERDWAHELPTVIVQLISESLNSLPDFLRFRAVCSPWRSASLPNPLRVPPQLPWLMIPYYPDADDADGDGDRERREDDGVRLFYDLWESKMRRIHLPETIGRMCCASCRGWLVLVATRGTEVFLLNPITRARVSLPDFVTPVKIFGAKDERVWYEARYWFEPYIGNFVVSKMCFSSDLTDPDCVVMVFLQRTCRIFFCRVDDPCWTMVNMQPEEIRTEKFADATFYDGRFYLLSHEGVMRVYDLKYPGKTVEFRFPPEVQAANSTLLLEGKSGVYMVVCHPLEEEEGEEEESMAEEDEDDLSDGTEKGPKQRVAVYQLVRKRLALEQVADTSDTAIFYGDNHLCLAVCSDDWDSLHGDCMYMQFLRTPTGSKDKNASCYAIYFSKLGVSKPELMVTDIGERPLLWPAAPAMWFQPSLV